MECVKVDSNSGRGIYLDAQNKVWLCGFIDPLNDYDYTKKAEYYFKGMKHGTMMSCVPPAIYSDRFLRFMEQIISQDPDKNEQTSSTLVPM